MLRSFVWRGEVHRERDDRGAFVQSGAIGDAAHLHAADLVHTIKEEADKLRLIARDRLQPGA